MEINREKYIDYLHKEYTDMETTKGLERYIEEITTQLGIRLEDLRTDVKFPSPMGIKDMDKAVETIVEVIVNGKGLIVLNTDYDLDGITSGAIGYSALVFAMGVPEERVFILQNQRNLGNGFNSSGLEKMKSMKDVDIMITSDHGSSDEERYKLLKETVGCKIVVTDHHLFKSKPVTVDAFVNTQQEGDTYSKNISGGVTIWMVMMMVKDRLKEMGRQINEHRFNSIYPMAALTTVCDQMDMTDNTNRYIVYEGLKVLNTSRDMRWIEARKLSVGMEITSTDLAFKLGPIINSTGRMLNAETGSNFLTSNESSSDCRKMFNIIKEINEDRKTASVEAEILVKEQHAKDRKEVRLDDAICVAIEERIGGLAGPIASRFVDKYNVPTLIMYDNGDGTLKGSGRSVEGINLKAVLHLIMKHYKGLLISAEGHAGAVGVSMHKDKLKQFQSAFNKEVSKTIKVYDKRLVDFIRLEVVNHDTYLEIQKLGPFGRRWKEPSVAFKAVVDGAFSDRRRKHGMYKLRMVNGEIIDGFHFNGYDPKIRKDMTVEVTASVSGKGNGKIGLFIRDIQEAIPF